MLARFLVAVAAMVATVAASNFLVQFPVDANIGGVHVGDILTWGAFTYPVAFLVTDLSNRAFGPARARLVVVAGFAVAVVLSIWLATPRIAIASGSAFLVAQMLDISIFHRLRDAAWWQAPMISSLFSSALDTMIFFSLAMAPAFLVGQNFRAVYSYNPSLSYSLALVHLGDLIRGGGDFRQQFPGGERIPTIDEIKEIQTRLNARGFKTDEIGRAHV